MKASAIGPDRKRLKPLCFERTGLASRRCRRRQPDVRFLHRPLFPAIIALWLQRMGHGDQDRQAIHRLPARRPQAPYRRQGRLRRDRLQAAAGRHRHDRFPARRPARSGLPRGADLPFAHDRRAGEHDLSRSAHGTGVQGTRRLLSPARQAHLRPDGTVDRFHVGLPGRPCRGAPGARQDRGGGPRPGHGRALP